MAYAKLTLRPTVNRQYTPTLNEAGISFSQLIRFQNGLPQKIGGWQRLSEDTVVGTASGMHTWAALNGNPYLAVGSEQRLAIFSGGLLYDITPLRDSADVAVNFSTNAATYTATSGIPTITVSQTTHGLAAGATLHITEALSIGGLTLLGDYVVLTAAANSYTFDAGENATSNQSVGGPSAVTIVDAAHGAIVNDWVRVVPIVTVGGLLVQGLYQISYIVSANSYVVMASHSATGAGSPGAVSSFTMAGTSTATVTLASHGYSTGDIYTVHVSTAIAPATLFGPYTVTVTGANSFTIVADAAAAGGPTSENGGNVLIQYLIGTGYASATPLGGYGVGDYGSGDYGLSSDSAQLIAPLRQWSMDNWGEYLVATYSGYTVNAAGTVTDGGPIYYWAPPLQNGATLYVTEPAEYVTNSPLENTCLFVMMPAQILVAAGTETAGVFDPNLVRWCDVSDFNDWTATITNQAGSYRISTGSRIIGALLATQQALIWTDIDVWSMQYQGLPYVFGFNKIQSNCGLIAQRAAVSLGSKVYWMSQNNFFSLGSDGFRTLECSVWDVVFRNLDTQQTDKIFAWVNPLFNEVTWFFPSNDGDGDVDTYVKLNTENGAWDYGSLDRTAGDEGGVFSAPISVDANGYLQQHDIQGVYDADGEPISYFYETGFFDLAEGQDFVFVDKVLPDFIATEGTRIKFTLYSRDYAEGPTTTYGPYRYRWGSPYISVRVRGRQMAMRIAGDDLGSFARLGAVRYQISQDGRR
jgi:hypothetical protein